MRITNGLRQISFKSRISLILVTASLVSSIVIGVLGWTSGRNALETSINNQLTSIREAQAYQIETYFEQIIAQTRTLSENRMIVNAMRQFKAGYEIGLHSDLTDDEKKDVRGFYSKVFVDKLSQNLGTEPLAVMFEPRRTVASYFQYHYVVENPFPPGKKDMMTESDSDQTIYSKFHRFYQPLFRNLLKEFNFYDIFLIDMKSLNITYSVFKETDFATSLIDGPYQDSALGVLAKKIREQPTRGEVAVSDYRSYLPSYGAPAAFLGAPIYDGNEAIGILVIQLPADEINKATTYSKGWSKSGLGATGETYLVGSDRMMRSDARKLIEDPEMFYGNLDDAGLMPHTVQNIRVFETTIATMPVVSQSVQSAFERESGTLITRNYMGEPVLSAFAPLDIPGLDWVILSEMALTEAFGPISSLQRNIIVWGVVLVLFVTLLSMLVSRSIVRPIDALADGVSELRSGKENVVVKVDTQDEFGALAANFNEMVASISEKSRLIDTKSEENDRLLQNILPKAVIDRIKAGEQVADELQQVTVAYLHVTGLDEIDGPVRQGEMLETVLERLVELAENFEAEKIKTIGNTLVFACGVTRARLDHSKQILDFCIAALAVLDRINSEQDTRLNLRIGIAAGPLCSAVVGSRQFHYEIWGHAADQAARMRFAAAPGEILVSETVRQKIETQYALVPAGHLSMDKDDVGLFRVDTSATGRPTKEQT